MVMAMEQKSLSVLADHLVRQQWQANAMLAQLESILAVADQLTPECRTQWLAGIRCSWVGLQYHPRHRLLLLRELLLQWDDWTGVEQLCQLLAGRSDSQHDDWWELARARYFLSRSDAQVAVSCYLELKPDDEEGHYLSGAIQKQRQVLAELSLPLTAGELRLVPLHPLHCSNYLWQYNSPDISRLCDLPEFTGEEQWQNWLQESWDWGDSLPLALMHDQWGLIGSLNLVLSEGVGAVYYWLGEDFRGYGLMKQALSLLLDQAVNRWGVRCCYARVYQHNGASRRLLDQTGFSILNPIRLQSEREVLFYRRGPDMPVASVLRELKGLCQRIQVGEDLFLAA